METLIIFGRAPGVGSARNKLARELGEVEAERLYAAFLSDAAATAASWRRRAVAGQPRQVALYVPDSADDALVVETAATCSARICVHSGTELVEQMAHAVQDELDRGAERVFLLSSSAPTLPVHLLEEALRAVLYHDVVVGPGFDGGCWGLGLRRDPDARPEREAGLREALFQKIAWGTPGSLGQAMERLHKAGFTLHMLPFWLDVTDPADLSRLKLNLRYQELRGSPAGAATRMALSLHAGPPVPSAAPLRGARRA
ncbi:MAG: DUF2064 domain-containing protein [Myxococcota bacterium]